MSIEQAFAKAISEGDEVAINAFIDYYLHDRIVNNNNNNNNKYYLIIVESGEYSDRCTYYVKIPKYIPIKEAKEILTYKAMQYSDDRTIQGIVLVYMEFDTSDFETDIAFHQIGNAQSDIWKYITPAIAKCINEYDYSFWTSKWNDEEKMKFQFGIERCKEIARKFKG